MTPDEVVSKLQLFINKLDNPSPGGTTLQIPKQSIQSAITFIQDYQKLREKIEIGKLDGELSCAYNDWLSTGKDYGDLCSMQADAIVTYLQQPTEPIER